MTYNQCHPHTSNSSRCSYNQGFTPNYYCHYINSVIVPLNPTKRPARVPRTPPVAPKVINFNPSDQDIDGLQFVLGKSDNDLELMLSTVPTPQDKELLLGESIDDQRAKLKLENFLTKTGWFLTSKGTISPEILVYLVYDKDQYVGFGVIEFFSYNYNRKVLDPLLSPQSKDTYDYILSGKYVWANIGVAVHPDFRRQGYGQRIVNGLLHILYTQTNTRIATYISNLQNIASIALALKTGFTEVEAANENNRIFIVVFER